KMHFANAFPSLRIFVKHTSKNENGPHFKNASRRRPKRKNNCSNRRRKRARQSNDNLFIGTGSQCGYHFPKFGKIAGCKRRIGSRNPPKKRRAGRWKSTSGSV